MFEQIRTLIRMAEHASSKWVTPRGLVLSESLTRLAERAFREWVTHQYLSRSEPLTGMVDHASSLWVALCKSELLMRMVEHVFSLWVLSGLWPDQNHWLEWLNMHPECKSLSSVWSEQNQSQMRVAEHTSREWVSSIEQIKATDENGWTCIQVVSYSSMFE